MTNQALYFYHAPDNRIYGPATFANLQEWSRQGRLIASSKLQRKSDGDFTTWERVQENNPISIPAEVLAEESSLEPANLNPPPPPIPTTLTILEQAVKLYGQNFQALSICALLIQLPSLPIGILIEASEYKYHIPFLPTLSQNKEYLILFIAGLAVLLIREVGLSFLTILLATNHRHERPNFTRALRQALSLAPTIALSLVPRIIFLFLSMLPACMCLGSALLVMKSGSSPVVELLLLLLTLLLVIPPTLLFLRFLLVPQIITLEKRPVVGALRRSNALSRYNSGQNLLTAGEFRLLILILATSALMLPFLFGSVTFFWGDFLKAVTNGSTTIHPPLSNLIGSQVVMYLGNALVSPFFASGIYLYYRYTREHVSED